MHAMTFHPVLGDIGAQVVQIGITSLAAGNRALASLIGLNPAGIDEISLRAVQAFQQEAASMLELYRAAQEELMRAGEAFTQIAESYIDADKSAATRWN